MHVLVFYVGKAYRRIHTLIRGGGGGGGGGVGGGDNCQHNSSF